MAISSLIARLGGVVAPFVGSLQTFHPKVPPAIYGAVAIFAGLLACLLPETSNKKLPDTIEEGAKTECTWKNDFIAKKKEKADAYNVCPQK